MAHPVLFKWKHFQPDIILLNVRWYCRYALSYRDLEEMMAERGLTVDHRKLSDPALQISELWQRDISSPSFSSLSCLKQLLQLIHSL